jgi:hypothetical protein
MAVHQNELIKIQIFDFIQILHKSISVRFSIKLNLFSVKNNAMPKIKLAAKIVFCYCPFKIKHFNIFAFELSREHNLWIKSVQSELKILKILFHKLCLRLKS